MPDSRDRLQAVPDGYPKFLHDKDLAQKKHRAYLVRRLLEFLLFARERGGYTFEQCQSGQATFRSRPQQNKVA